ncbi:MFS transporter [Pseudomonas sp. SWRI18]|uniref:MFS transporter n=1 Tax=Pseudomonas sp. SWRI18 TaxID=2753888 RepID=UPI00164791B3|nr:MFS transporter [Pseudomonas sp. SWRI18]MBC3301562.1 MFS transporter [Pseudomonas sp. SWRI18]
MNTRVAIDGLPLPSSTWSLLAAIILFAAIAPTILMTAPAVAAQLASQWHLSPSQIGDLFSVELGAMSLASLPAFWWLKRISWRLAAFTAAVVFIAANLLSMLADTYNLLLALRFISAIAGGSLMIICLASAAATANPGRIYGLWVMGQLVVGALGLAFLPTLFERYGLGACYLILAGLMALLLPLTRCFTAGKPAARQTSAAALPGSRLKTTLGILGLLTFYISLGGVWTFIGAIAAHAGISAQNSGEILAFATVIGIAGAGCASLVGTRLVLLPVGYGVMAVAVLLLLDEPGLWRFAVAAFVFKFTWTFVLPLILACLAKLDHSGKLMNASNLMIGTGLAIGPAIAGRLIETTSGFTALLLGGAAITLLSLVLMHSSRAPA